MAVPKTETQELAEAARRFLGVYLPLLHRTDMPHVDKGQAIIWPHQRAMVDLLAESPENVLIMAPRGSSKTMLIQGHIEWELGRASLEGGDWAKRHRVLLLSHSAHKAYSVSSAVMQTIVQPEYRYMFPKVRPSEQKWSESEWRVKGNEGEPHPTFIAAGIESPPLGGRFDKIYLDDIGDEKNMATPLQREKVKETLDRTVLPMLVPGGRVIDTCTRWAWDDTAKWAQERGFQELLLKALTQDADGNWVSYWPERFPVEYLLKLKGQNERAFAQQYQNEVSPEEGLVFERAWFADRFDWAPNEVLFRLNSWDTASGEGRNRSYSAGWDAVLTPDWHIYLLHCTRGQLPYSYLREAVADLSRRTAASAVIIEKKSSGQALVQDDRLRGVPIVEWQPAGQKGSPSRMEYNQRIASLCASGRVHLPSEFYCRRTDGTAGWLVDVERELFSYPDGDNDDVVDALCQMLWWVEGQRVRQLRFAPKPALRWAPPEGMPTSRLTRT